VGGNSRRTLSRWRRALRIAALVIVVLILLGGLWRPPIDIEADLTVSRVEFVVADTMAHTFLPDVRFAGLAVTGFDSVRYGNGPNRVTIGPRSARARAGVELLPGRQRHGYFEGLTVPGGSQVSLTVPSRPETSLTISIQKPGGQVYFGFSASAGDSVRWSNDNGGVGGGAPTSGLDSRTRFEVFANGPVSITVYPDTVALPGLVTPDPIPTGQLDFTRWDRDGNRARSALMEAGLIRFVRYPRLDPASLATFQVLEMSGRRAVYLEASRFERIGDRPALRLRFRGSVHELRAAGGGPNFLPSSLRRLQHDDLFWPILALAGGILAVVFANFPWWESSESPETGEIASAPTTPNPAAPAAGPSRAPAAASPRAAKR
jgi:hypothetical protein